jgi:hypothetical protein
MGNYCISRYVKCRVCNAIISQCSGCGIFCISSEYEIPRCTSIFAFTENLIETAAPYFELFTEAKHEMICSSFFFFETPRFAVFSPMRFTISFLTADLKLYEFNTRLRSTNCTIYHHTPRHKSNLQKPIISKPSFN